eukprot:gnl/MRDRNA2_/MRDRNA2_110348_c0_seq1.p1 gnl/MRDRNA2_/MRDRNA2_110348_c0~~gnl/MRDRNA2_/MRDRNA2_110348_c0_seq1.p1  ORF type:complete len:473 (+),score=90.75 gnl/MRDRNA2_/MRDRNA2_110348_c0_seq1:176-1594(+)
MVVLLDSLHHVHPKFFFGEHVSPVDGSKGAESLEDADPSCTVSNSDRHDAVTVVVRPDNTRVMQLESLPKYWQSEVKCAGAAPTKSSKEISSCQLSDPAFRCISPDFQDDGLGRFWYVKHMSNMILDQCKGRPVSTLFLGLGGGTMQTYLHHQCPQLETVTVESNPNVVDAARHYFGFGSGGSPVLIQQDAHTALHDLAGRPKKFDFIIVDIDDTPLSSQDIMDAHTLLKPGGRLLQNWNNDHFSRTEEQLANLKSTFHDVTTTRNNQNSVIMSRKGAAEPQDQKADARSGKSQDQPAESTTQEITGLFPECKAWTKVPDRTPAPPCVQKWFDALSAKRSLFDALSAFEDTAARRVGEVVDTCWSKDLQVHDTKNAANFWYGAKQFKDHFAKFKAAEPDVDYKIKMKSICEDGNAFLVNADWSCHKCWHHDDCAAGQLVMRVDKSTKKILSEDFQCDQIRHAGQTGIHFLWG